MTDPLLSLAFSLQANRGVYALLVGSGVSRKARIPTGWAIVEDLIKRLACTRGEDCSPDPSAWYAKTFGEGADYSRLLEQLGRSPADRREILRPYFEPNAQEQDEGAKRPTEAHRAIARLMKAGSVRVVLTTNFDRLLELALEDEGVRPLVIDSADKAAGSRPLVHIPATLVKLHGDYLDDRIKNTLTELSSYEPPIDALLDRVLDEYGLIVCGWSGDWDPALRAAIERCPSRRFPTYWTYVASPSAQAVRLIEHRQAIRIQISGADEFFSEVQQKVEALDSYGERHPASAAVAVAMLERYLVSGEHRIHLLRLMTQETERVYASAREVATESVRPDDSEVRLRARRLLSATETLIRLFVAGCYWGEAEHEQVWVRCLRRLMGPFEGNGCHVTWLELARYPAKLVFYAGGLASYCRGRLKTTAALFHDAKVIDRSGEEEAAFNVLNGWMRLPNKLLPEGEPAEPGRYWRVPASESLYRTLRGFFRELILDDRDFERTFDRFEYLLSLAAACAKNGVGPPGRFTLRMDEGDRGMAAEFRAEIERMKASWPPVESGVIRLDEKDICSVRQEFEKQQRRMEIQIGFP